MARAMRIGALLLALIVLAGYSGGGTIPLKGCSCPFRDLQAYHDFIAWGAQTFDVSRPFTDCWPSRLYTQQLTLLVPYLQVDTFLCAEVAFAKKDKKHKAPAPAPEAVPTFVSSGHKFAVA